MIGTLLFAIAAITLPTGSFTLPPPRQPMPETNPVVYPAEPEWERFPIKIAPSGPIPRRQPGGTN